MTKSSRSRPWKLIRPCTASSHASSASGTAKRMTNGSPAARRRASSSGVSRQQRPSYRKGRPAATASSAGRRAPRRCRSSGTPARSPAAARRRHGAGPLPPPWKNGPSSQSTPSHFRPVEDDLGVRVGAALLVGVLDAQDEGAAGLPGVEPVEQRRAGAADVEVAGGRGGEADANRSGCHRRGET